MQMSELEFEDYIQRKPVPHNEYPSNRTQLHWFKGQKALISMIIRKLKTQTLVSKNNYQKLETRRYKSCLLAANLDKGVDCYVTSSLSSFGNLANGPETLF